MLNQSPDITVPHCTGKCVYLCVYRAGKCMNLRVDVLSQSPDITGCHCAGKCLYLCVCMFSQSPDITVHHFQVNVCICVLIC